MSSEVVHHAAPDTNYYGHDSDGMYGHDYSRAHRQDAAAGPDMSQLQNTAMDAANMALSWVRQHPLMSAAIVAAVVAIGPRRIMKSVAAGGTAVGAAGAFALRNPQNIEMITRLFNTVTSNYRQRNTDSASQFSPP